MRDPYFNSVILNVRGFNSDVNPFRDNGPLNIINQWNALDITRDVSSKFTNGFTFTASATSYIQYREIPAFGTGDFTIEAWTRPNRAAQPDDWGAIATNYMTGTGRGNTWGLFVRKSGELHFNVYDNSGQLGVQVRVPVPGTVVDGKIQHIAVSRSGDQLRLFLDGNLMATTTTAVDLNAVNTISIGQTPGYANKYVGSIEDFKITKAARYKTNFAPADSLSEAYYGGVPPFLIGTGKIGGVVKVKGVPLVNAKCILFHETSNAQLLHSSTNDIGRFEFTGLNKDELFYVVVKQNDTSWEHIVSSRRNPA